MALGLAVGIGLVVAVTAASTGVSTAQAKVLRSLYGIGTDVTVTTVPSDKPTGNGGGVMEPGKDEQDKDFLALPQGLGTLDAS